MGRMRWKLWHYKNKNKKKKKIETYGFKTPHHPPVMKELKEFENDMADLIKNIEFRRSSNPLQEQMKKDMKRIRDSPDVIVQADKTPTLYLLLADVYNKYLLENITKEYQRADDKTINSINAEAASIAKDLELDDRIEGMCKMPAYLTIKDHKDDFPARLKFRTINPCKTNVGNISKIKLDRINNEVRKATGLNQMKSTGRGGPSSHG